MPVSLELILIGAGLLIVGVARLRGRINSKFWTAGPGSARFDWTALAMTIFGGIAIALGLALVGVDWLKALFTWLKS